MANIRVTLKPRPIHRPKVVGLGIWRIPERDCITPRLQKPEPIERVPAIGFGAKLVSDDE